METKEPEANPTSNDEKLPDLGDLSLKLLTYLTAHGCNYILAVHNPQDKSDIRQFSGNGSWIAGEAAVLKAMAIQMMLSSDKERA